MLHAHWRLAELWQIKRGRELTDNEQAELEHCLQLNLDFAWKRVALNNKCLAAQLIGNMDEVQDICAEIEKLNEQVLL